MIKTAQMFETGVNLPEDRRAQLIDLLNQHLADGIDLYSHTKQAHWNIKGMHFFQLHELFDELAADLLKEIDEIAERATALGGMAKGTVHMAAAASKLSSYPEDIHQDTEILRTLVKHYSEYATSLRAAVETAMDLGDEGTADLFIGLSRLVDKQMWFLQAHLQA